MRFDDSLRTVLAADASTAFGAQSAFRQLVDLLGRGRVAADPEILQRLRDLRESVPAKVRAAAARALALGRITPALVAFFAEDDAAVAAPVIRTAGLSETDWLDLLPRLGPVARGVLRQRDDLDPAVRRGLESFGSVDFTLGHDGALARRGEGTEEAAAPSPEAESLSVEAGATRFEIADLVARLAAYQERREADLPVAGPAVLPVSDSFRFETDASGTISYVEGALRGPIVGLSLIASGVDAAVDGTVTGAFRRRGVISNGRLLVGGNSTASGSWRLSAVPAFDHATGRFIGYRGAARRPRAEETATPRVRDVMASESLRRLVHELRTPTTAISGFSELIESELLGPVPQPYRERAGEIREQAAGLIAAIDDLDLAARIEGDALELRPAEIALAPLVDAAMASLASLAQLRGCALAASTIDFAATAQGDERAIERLIGRLLAAVVSAGGAGERLLVTLLRDDDSATLLIDRPRALASVPDDVLLSIDAEREAALPGAPLLGTGFALRLARNLAAELGGTLAFGSERLTLRLPAALDCRVEQATTL